MGSGMKAAESARPPSFGEHVRWLCSQRRLNTSELAQETGIAVARLLALEIDSGTPNRREIARLARAFRVSEDSLLERAGHVRMRL